MTPSPGRPASARRIQLHFSEHLLFLILLGVLLDTLGLGFILVIIIVLLLLDGDLVVNVVEFGRLGLGSASLALRRCLGGRCRDAAVLGVLLRGVLGAAKLLNVLADRGVSGG